MGMTVNAMAGMQAASETVSDYSVTAKAAETSEKKASAETEKDAVYEKSAQESAKAPYSINKMSKDGTFDNLSKREKLQITRQRAKLEKNLGSIADLSRLPSALFVVDVMKEHIAVAEANRLGIPVFGIVDTNSNPENIDFVIPANDDASKSIEIILDTVVAAIAEGLQERKIEKLDNDEPEEEEAAAPAPGKRRRVRRNENAEAPKAEAPAEEAKAEAPVEAAQQTEEAPKAE